MIGWPERHIVKYGMSKANASGISEMSTVLPNIAYLVVNSVGRAALDATIKPGVLQPWVDELDRYVQANGKFSQFAAAYLPLSPPPAFWDYKCKKCLKWGPNQGQADRTCLWIQGDISPEGWCSIWVPNTGYKAFTWPQELISGNW